MKSDFEDGILLLFLNIIVDTILVSFFELNSNSKKNE